MVPGRAISLWLIMNRLPPQAASKIAMGESIQKRRHLRTSEVLIQCQPRGLNELTFILHCRRLDSNFDLLTDDLRTIFIEGSNIVAQLNSNNDQFKLTPRLPSLQGLGTNENQVLRLMVGCSRRV